MLDGVVGMHNDLDFQSQKLSPHRCVTAGEGSSCTHCRSVVGEKTSGFYVFLQTNVDCFGWHKSQNAAMVLLKNRVWIMPKSLTAWRLLLQLSVVTGIFKTPTHADSGGCREGLNKEQDRYYTVDVLSVTFSLTK